MEKDDKPDPALIVRFLSGDSSKEEKSELERWADSSKENRKYLDEHVSLWELSESVKDISTIEVEKDWEKVSRAISRVREIEGMKSRPKPQGRISPIVRIAAFLTLAVGLYFSYRLVSPLFTKPKIVATTNQKSEVLLPDGTKVFLNKNTSLTYSEEFGDQIREVVLRGEAFFEVTKDQARPFLIKSGNSITEVVGTSFNIDEADSGKVVVTVSTGKVLFYPASDKNESLTLLPGEQGTLESEREMVKRTNEDINVLAWKTGVLAFRNTTLPEVISDLNRYYGQNIQLQGSFNRCTITSTFQGQSLDEVLTELELILSIQIVREESKIVITGTECTP